MQVQKHKTIGLWLDPKSRQRLETVCEMERISKSEILGKLLDLFLSDIDFQRKIVEEIKKL